MVNIKNLIPLFGIITIMLFAGCSENKMETDKIPSHQDEETKSSQLVNIPDSVATELGIVLKNAGPGFIQNHIDLTGEIKAEPSSISHIVPRFAGIVKNVNKTLGEKVKKGEVLAVIESNESLVSYDVTSLIDGTIIEMHMTEGELISDQTHAFTVADLRKVWADLSVYQKDLNKIKIGQTAEISSGLNQPESYGTISYISPILDEATRTATTRVKLDNYSGKWKPGMFVTANVVTSNKKLPLVIDKSALHIIDDKIIVFVKHNNGFIPQQVFTGLENDKTVEIKTGLKLGDIYAAQGSFTIKAEMLKESFGGDEH